MFKLATVLALTLLGFTLLNAIAEEPEQPTREHTLSGIITFDDQSLHEGKFLIHTGDKQIIGCLLDEDGIAYFSAGPTAALRLATFRRFESPDGRT